MSLPSLLPLLLIPIFASAPIFSPSSPLHTHSISSQLSTALRKRLFRPLIGEDGKIYSCSGRSLFAFASNASILWTLPLGFNCNVRLPPSLDATGKIYLVAENRVLEINPLNIGTSKSALQVFFGPEPGQEAPAEITGLSVSTLSSSVFITVSKRGLFAYVRRGKLLWSVGPVLQQFGYRQGCRRGLKDCYFTSVPVIDQCEISNSQGELYSLSTRSPYFRWIQDLSSFDKSFTVTAGNNGRLYVTVPVKALLLALDVSSGSILWQRSIGPLSTAEYAPAVDSNGWISIGSLDGFLYSFSPDGILKKYNKLANQDSVFQVSPVLDCSGYAIYVSQSKMEAKISNTIAEYTYVSAMKPTSVVFMLLVPATGSIYWSESYPGRISSFISTSDLQHFVLDEEVLLAFLGASKTGNPLKCRTIGQKLSSSCSKTISKQTSIYTGNERAILLFLLFETAVLIVLAGLLRFCCIFWRKKKIQGQGLGSFLEKRHSLRMRKKAFDRTIMELGRKAAEEASASNQVLENFGDLVREREGIERKLSTTYSLGRDGSRSILPIFDWKPKSHYFHQSMKKVSVALFRTLSHTSSRESSSGSVGETSSCSDGDNVSACIKGKAKAPTEEESSSDDEVVPDIEYRRKVSVQPPLSIKEFMVDGSKMLKRRSLSSTN